LTSHQVHVDHDSNSYFYFDGKLIPLTSDHKHLGITFSEEANWNKHVENLIKSVSKHICVLRKLKYKLNRKNKKHDFSFVWVERHQPSL
jgi:hypothetical protein